MNQVSPVSAQDASQSRKPTLGVLAVLLPLMTAAPWWFFESSPGITGALNGYAGMFILAFLYVYTFVLSGTGIVISILALVRREPYRFLPIIGAILNFVAGSWIIQNG